MGVSKEGAGLKPLGMQGSPFVQGAIIRGVFDTIAIWDDPLFSYQAFKLILIRFGKALPFGDMVLLAARELELGYVWGLNHLLFVLQLCKEWHDKLANVGPGHYGLGLSQDTPNTEGL